MLKAHGVAKVRVYGLGLRRVLLVEPEEFSICIGI